MSVEDVNAVFLNTRAFLSFQRIHTQLNQIILKNICVNLGKPGIILNWVKCWWRSPGETEGIPNQSQTRDQRDSKASHTKNKCFAVSWLPQPNTQPASSRESTRHRNKLSLVGCLLRIRRQTNTDILEGMFLCHMSTTWALSTNSADVVRKL